jgi:hypothetical protein
MKKDFYIGYIDKAAPVYGRLLARVVLLLILVALLISFLFVKGQKDFSTSSFELGKPTELVGTLVKKPVPMLKLWHGKNTIGEEVAQNVLLVAFGKFGALKDVMVMETQEGRSLDGATVKLNGTLIYSDGKAIMQLDKGPASLVEVLDQQAPTQPVIQELGEVNLKGEIIDPKCYFGVMKPATGKPHRSCAVRCIAGGIPPVLKVSDDANQNEYYLLVGSNGQPVNEYLLEEVGKPGFEAIGKLRKIDDWYICYLSRF